MRSVKKSSVSDKATTSSNNNSIIEPLAIGPNKSALFGKPKVSPPAPPSNQLEEVVADNSNSNIESNIECDSPPVAPAVEEEEDEIDLT
jgi:hypothetical protein